MAELRGAGQFEPFATPQATGPAPTLAPATGGASAPATGTSLRGEGEFVPFAGGQFEPPGPVTTALSDRGITLPDISVAETSDVIAPDTAGLTPEQDPIGEEAFLSTPMAGTEFSASQASDEASLGGRLKLVLSDLFVSDPQQVAAIIEENDPGAKITRNETGEATAVTVNGRTMPLNAPGISGRDIGALIGPTAAFIATRGLGSALVGGTTRGFLANAGLSALAGGGEAAIRRGVEAGIGGREFTEDLAPDIVAGTAAGAGGEVAGRAIAGGLNLVGRALAPAVRRAFGIERGVPVTFKDPNTGRTVLNETGRDAVRQAGGDPNSVTPTMARQMQAEVNKLPPSATQNIRTAPAGQPPAAAEAPLPLSTPQTAPSNIAVNRAFTEQAGLPATRGGLSGVESELASEANLAGRTMLLAENPLKRQQRLVGEGLKDTARQRGGLDTTSASEQAATLTQSIRQAGEGARETSQRLYRGVANRVRDGERLDLSTRQLADKVTKPLSAPNQRRFPGIDFNALPRADAARRLVLDFTRRQGNKTHVDFTEVEGLRRQINQTFIKGQRDPAELRALSRVVQTLDNWVEGVRVRGDVLGNASLLRDTIGARRAWRRYARDFQSRNAGETVLRDVTRGSTSDEQAVNRLFSVANGPAAVRQLQRASGGADSTAMVQLRETAWRRFMVTDQGTMRSPRQILARLDKAVNQRGAFYRSVFKGDLRQINRLRTALKAATRKDVGGQRSNRVNQTMREVLVSLATARAATRMLGGGGADIAGGAAIGGAAFTSGVGLPAVGVAAAAVPLFNFLVKRPIQAARAATGGGRGVRGLLETPAAAVSQQGLLSAGGR